jgi:hypothetical protein
MSLPFLSVTVLALLDRYAVFTRIEFIDELVCMCSRRQSPRRRQADVVALIRA